MSCLALVVLWFLVSKLFGPYTGLLSVALVAVSPPVVGRTLAGFADKDGPTLLLSLAAFCCYVYSIGEAQNRKLFPAALATGGCLLLLGWTWQGVGVFVAVTAITDGIVLLSSIWNLRLAMLSLCRHLPVLVGLPLTNPIYRDWSHPFILLAVGLPLLLVMVTALTAITLRVRTIARILSLGHRIPVSLMLTIAASLLAGTWMRNRLFLLYENFMAPFGASTLALSIQELHKQGLLDWAFWPGIFYLIACIGALIIYASILRSLKVSSALCDIGRIIPALC